MKFQCVNTCLLPNGTHVAADEILEISEARIVTCPECKGKKGGCKKCGFAGRSFPPHHFIALESPEEIALKAKEAEEAEAKKIEDLRGKLKSKGKDFDPTWDVPRLEAEVAKAEKTGGGAQG